MLYQICLKRVSSSKDLKYYIVVSTKISGPSSRVKENLGYYSLNVDKWSNKYMYINMDRFFFWLNKGVSIKPIVFVLINPLLYFYKNYFKI